MCKYEMDGGTYVWTDGRTDNVKPAYLVELGV